MGSGVGDGSEGGRDWSQKTGQEATMKVQQGSIEAVLESTTGEKRRGRPPWWGPLRADGRTSKRGRGPRLLGRRGPNLRVTEIQPRDY